LVAVLEQLETATIDPTLLTDGQTVALVEAQTIADLSSLAGITRSKLGGAASASTSVLNFLSTQTSQYPSVVASLQADAKLFTPAAEKPPVTVVDPSPPASGVEQFL
jgi:hypothetical protein